MMTYIPNITYTRVPHFLLQLPLPACCDVQVIIPGSAGEYGVTAGHSPIVAELKPGVIQVLHEAVSAEVHVHSLGVAYE